MLTYNGLDASIRFYHMISYDSLCYDERSFRSSASTRGGRPRRAPTRGSARPPSFNSLLVMHDLVLVLSVLCMYMLCISY